MRRPLGRIGGQSQEVVPDSGELPRGALRRLLGGGNLGAVARGGLPGLGSESGDLPWGPLTVAGAGGRAPPA